MGQIDQKMPKFKPLTVPVRKKEKAQQRTQFAAFCYRRVQGKLQVLLVTSRTRKRWILPKGWPMDGKTPAEAALQEALEEGGVVGKALDMPLGVFGYDKIFAEKDTQTPVLAIVYPIKVKKLKTNYLEKSQRKRKWMSLSKASKKVSEKQLRAFLKNIDPASLP